MGTVNAVLNLFCAACSLLLYLSLLPQHQPYQTKDTKVFRRILLAAVFMLLFSGVGWLFVSSQPILFRLFSTCSALAFYVVLALYTLYMLNVLKLKNAFTLHVYQFNSLLCAFGALLCVVNLFRPFLYDFTDPHFQRPYGVLLFLLISLIVLLDNAYLIFLARSQFETRQFILLLVLPALPLLSLLLHFWSNDLHLLYAILFFVLLCNYVRLSRMQLAAFDTQREKLHNLQVRSTTERMKPHYIYNVLTSIYYLCETDPQMAQRAVGTFSDYLRSVLDNLDAGELISFRQELQTIQNYLSLEQMRFGDRFHVHYNIAADQFLLPPFTVQPLVENAVKHGVGKTDLVGEIWIESYETPTDYIVVVRDNCGGFEVE